MFLLLSCTSIRLHLVDLVEFLSGTCPRTDLIDLFNQMIPEFNHKETGKFLDGRI